MIAHEVNDMVQEIEPFENLVIQSPKKSLFELMVT